MPAWGWFVVVLLVVAAGVLAIRMSVPSKPDEFSGASHAIGSVGLDDDARAEIRRLLDADKKIQAIKVFRERTGAGLKDAKDAVEAMDRGEVLPASPTILDAARSGPVPWDDLVPRLTALKAEGKAIAAIKELRERTGLSLLDAKNAVDRL